MRGGFHAAADVAAVAVAAVAAAANAILFTGFALQGEISSVNRLAPLPLLLVGVRALDWLARAG